MQDLRIKGMVDSRVSESDFVMFLAFDVGGSRYLKKYTTNSKGKKLWPWSSASRLKGFGLC